MNITNNEILKENLSKRMEKIIMEKRLQEVLEKKIS